MAKTSSKGGGSVPGEFSVMLREKSFYDNLFLSVDILQYVWTRCFLGAEQNVQGGGASSVDDQFNLALVSL